MPVFYTAATSRQPYSKAHLSRAKPHFALMQDGNVHLPDGQITSTSGAVAPSIPSRKNNPLCLSGKSSL
jgi:hypothetical protein